MRLNVAFFLALCCICIWRINCSEPVHLMDLLVQNATVFIAEHILMLTIMFVMRHLYLNVRILSLLESLEAHRVLRKKKISHYIYVELGSSESMKCYSIDSGSNLPMKCTFQCYCYCCGPALKPNAM